MQHLATIPRGINSLPPQVVPAVGGRMQYSIEAWLQTKIADDGPVPPHAFSDALFPQKVRH